MARHWTNSLKGSRAVIILPCLILVLGCGSRSSSPDAASDSARLGPSESIPGDDESCKEFEQYLNKYFPEDTYNPGAERMVFHRGMAAKAVSTMDDRSKYPAACPPESQTNGAMEGPCNGDYFPPRALGFHVQAEKICKRPPPEWWNIEALATGHLERWREPSLMSTPSGVLEVYRLLYAPPKGGSTVIRIERNRDGRYLTAKFHVCQTSGPAKKVLEHRQLTVEQWAKLKAMLNKSAFFDLPVQVNHQMRGGTIWLLEGKDEENYQLVARTSPEIGFFRRTGEYLLALAGLEESDLSCTP